MSKYLLNFVELHSPLFMNGSNLGTKINGPQRGAKLLLDEELQVVWIHFKNKVSFVPLASVASADVSKVPDEILELLAPKETVEEPVKRGPGRPPSKSQVAQPLNHQPYVPMPDFDPDDVVAAATHREMVRAASANAYHNPNPVGIDDRLIQESRNAAMGIKNQRTSQVQNAQQVGQQAAVAGKKKPISHAELQAESKE